MVHVYLGHGDSDKGVSVSNQVKAYDWCFLAGQAALDRTLSAVMLYDAEARSVLIGQPQLDGASSSSRHAVPRWPADRALRPDVGGVAAVGVLRIARDARREDHARTLGHYRVIYRPHPLNGVISAVVRRGRRPYACWPSASTPTCRSRSRSPTPTCSITDVSAVTLNWLPTGKPMLVTKPLVAYPPSPLMIIVPQVAATDDFAAVVGAHLSADPTKADRDALIEHYLGDPAPGAATARFIAACEDVMAIRDREWDAAKARGANGT